MTLGFYKGVTIDGATDFLKGLQGKVIDAATYQLLLRNFHLQTDNNSLLKESNDLLQKQLNEQKLLNSQFTEQISELKVKVAHYKSLITTEVEFDEIEGILWRKDPEGGYESKPRCPNCSTNPVLHQFPPNAKMHWTCSACKSVFDYVEPPK